VTQKYVDVTQLPSFIGHHRLEGHSAVNPINRIITGLSHTYVLYRAWSPDVKTAPHDLQSHLQAKGKFPESNCRQYFQQILTLVRDCHRNNIILRDLKLRKFIFKSITR
jgi:tribbles-like protein